MATKPTSTFQWAKNPTYTVGPFIGSNTKILGPLVELEGAIPGQPIVSEYLNYPLNITSQWVSDWLDHGTFNNVLDAHIVETDSTGATSIAALNLGGTTYVGNPLTVVDNTGDPSAACVAILHNGDAPCLTASTAGESSTAIFTGFAATSPCFYIEVSGSGPGQKILTTGSNALEAQSTSGRAVKADVTSGTAVEGTASANGFAGFFTSHGSLDTIRATNNSTGNALRVQNLGSGRGVSVTTTTGNSIEATSTTGYAAQLTSNNALSVARLIQSGTGNALVSTNSGASPTIDTSNSGSGLCLRANASANYAVLAEGDPTAPAKGSLRLSPQVNPPSSPDAGGLFFDSVSDSFGYGISNGGSPVNKFAWGTRFGFCEGHNRSLVGVILPLNAVTTVSTVTVEIPDVPDVGDGFVEISFHFQMYSNGAFPVLNTIGTVIRDETSGINYSGSFFTCNGTSGGVPITVGQSGTIRVPAIGAGTRQFALRLDTTLQATVTFTIIAPCMSVRGVYETDTSP